LAAIKGSLRMRRLLQRALREGPPDAPPELRIVYAGEVLRVRSRELARVRRELHSRIHHPNAARGDVRRALIEALWRARPEGVSWTAALFAGEIADRNEFVRFVWAWWPILAPAEVLGWLADPLRVMSAGRDWLSADDVSALAASWAGAPGDLSVADVALVDELRVMLGSAPPTSPRRDRNRSLGIDLAGDELRELSDRLKSSLGEAAVVLGAAENGRPVMVASFTGGVVERGLSAAEVVKEAARLMGGGGGGRETMAQAGGKDAGRLEDALAAARKAIETKLTSSSTA